MNYRTKLNLGEAVYITIVFHIPVFFELTYLMVTIFTFDGVTLQTSHTRVKRGSVRVKCHNAITIQCSQPGLEPRLLEIEKKYTNQIPGCLHRLLNFFFSVDKFKPKL